MCIILFNCHPRLSPSLPSLKMPTASAYTELLLARSTPGWAVFSKTPPERKGKHHPKAKHTYIQYLNNSGGHSLLGAHPYWFSFWPHTTLTLAHPRCDSRDSSPHCHPTGLWPGLFNTSFSPDTGGVSSSGPPLEWTQSAGIRHFCPAALLNKRYTQVVGNCHVLPYGLGIRKNHLWAEKQGWARTSWAPYSPLPKPLASVEAWYPAVPLPLGSLHESTPNVLCVPAKSFPSGPTLRPYGL